MTERAPRLWPTLALLWLLAVAALAAHQAGFWREARLDTDVLALLPGEGADPALQAANRRIVDAASRQVVVLVGGSNWADARRGAEAFIATLASGNGALQAVAQPAGALDAAFDFYRPQRRGLLTPAQREQLQRSTAADWIEPALARLYSPGTGGGVVSWREDPLGLWPDWWQARAGRGLQLRDGLLALSDGEGEWAVLRLESRASAFQLDGERPLGEALAGAGAAARAAGGETLQLLTGGVPLHAEAAAAQARREVSTIGLGSMMAVVALVWLAFRSLRPILLVSTSLLVGCAAAVAVTALVFGQVHVLTLVFGASLVGVAVDYGIHYFASRQAQSAIAPHTVMRQLMPVLALALLTSALAYLTLGIAPFPGLRQMAVFSATGLTAAFLTVVLWFPWLDRVAPRPSRFAAAVAGSLARWPRWRPGPTGYTLALLALAFIALGLWRLEANDDLRSLQSSPAALLAQEQQIGRLLGMPSPAQFFLLQAASPEQLLQAEEVLAARLQPIVAAGRVGGWRAVSDWLPSAQRQRADAALVAPVEDAVLARAAALLDEALPSPGAETAALEVADWLQQPISEPARPLWLGRIGDGWASVVMLEGLAPAALQEMSTVAADLPGVRWIDRTAGMSRVLEHYRERMGWLLLAGYAAVGFALWLRFRRRAWRALLPTALASLLTLAALGWMGQPVQLFTVLGQLLLLGIGVDYGIFLLEHRDDPASWLAVSLGAASTLLAFGLLALSSTPALNSFGLGLLLGVSLVWLLSPCFRPDSDPVAAS